MVSSLLVEALNDPTRVLREIYDPSSEIDIFPSTVSSHFSKVFESVDTFQEIPPLDVKHPPESHSPRALVRFRAMVQDTSPSPEIYLSKLEGNKCGGWGIANETVREGVDYSYADLQECTVVWAVSVPGENQWSVEEIDGTIEKSHLPSQRHKFPLPDVPHVGVQVKIYDHSTPDRFKSTDIITFVGILSSEPIYSELDRDTPHKVPTLHVLFSQPQEPSILGGVIEADSSSITELREDLISWIADESLGGDRDAAEWVLLTSVAKVQSRNPPILPPSLTLAFFPSPSSSPPPPPALSHVMSLLLPLSVTLPLSLPLLNTSTFTPESKDEDLHAGNLQLPAGCTVFVTESGVAEGKLIEKGIMNLKVLQDVMSSQSLPYIFPFSQFSFPTDLGFVVFAEGRKSAFFQTSVTHPLQRPKRKPEEDLYKPPEKIALPSAQKLAQFRKLLSAAKMAKVQVGDAASEYIQNDFVRERQIDKSVSADDLILRMTVARLLALSLHEQEVSIDIWERAKELDRRRKARLS